ncbi:hypothetical protein ACLKA7_014721 [Drosophila subpalustris]
MEMEVEAALIAIQDEHFRIDAELPRPGNDSPWMLVENPGLQDVPRLKSPFQLLSCEHWTPASSFNPLPTETN